MVWTHIQLDLPVKRWLWTSNKITIFREEATSAWAGFHSGLLSWSNWNLIGDIGFCGGRKIERPEKTKPLEQGDNQLNKLNPDMVPGRNRTSGHIDGRRALSLLCCPCSPIITKHFFVQEITYYSALVFPSFRCRECNGWQECWWQSRF